MSKEDKTIVKIAKAVIWFVLTVVAGFYFSYLFTYFR